MSLPCLADSLYEAVNEGNVDTVTEFLKRGVNVNLLPTSGRTHLGRAAQLGHVKIVCLLLDADKFYSTPEEEQISPSDSFTSGSYHTQKLAEDFSCLKSYLKAPKDQTHKCCSPSIDSETYTCSDEVWSHEASDTNAGQQSDLESGANNRENTLSHWSSAQTDTFKSSTLDTSQPVGNVEGTVCGSNSLCTTTSTCSSISSIPTFGTSQFSGNNIGYYVYEYREEDELQADTEESSAPILSSTEDSDSALFEHKPPPHTHRHSSVLLHHTLVRGSSNIVSSDSEFETENYHRRRHIKHNHHRSTRHERDNGRPKVFSPLSQASNPFFAQLHKEYIKLGLSSPWGLRRTCDINQHDAYGRSTLHYATEQGHAYIVHILIKAGAKVDTVDAEHMTPLHLAAQRGYTEVVNLLLEGGAKVNNKMNDKSSPLHIAASRGYTDIVETLLDRGAKIDSLDSSDRTPLMLAVSRAHNKVAQLLIKRGAKVNIEEIHGYTPLCEAVWQKEVKLVQMLLKAKAKITQSHYLLHYVVLHRHYQLAEILLAARCIVNLRDDKGDTPLIIASRTCQPAIIRLLLKHGANANYPNGLSGVKPLHEAIEGTRDAQFEDFLTVFRLLRSHGAKLDVETLTDGDTPLYRALLLEKNKAAALLIREGCDVNVPPPNKSTDYLKMASSRGNAFLTSLIILAGFKLGKITWLNDSNLTVSLHVHLKKVKSQPLSLLDQTRIFIRRRLGEKVTSSIYSCAELPLRLKKFLLLKDIDDSDTR